MVCTLSLVCSTVKLYHIIASDYLFYHSYTCITFSVEFLLLLVLILVTNSIVILLLDMKYNSYINLCFVRCKYHEQLWLFKLFNVQVLGSYSTAQMLRRTCSPIASALTIANQRGMSLVSLVSIYPQGMRLVFASEMGTLAIDSFASVQRYIWVVPF